MSGDTPGVHCHGHTDVKGLDKLRCPNFYDMHTQKRAHMTVHAVGQQTLSKIP